MTVCILTAGRGTRMHQPNMNKALLPIGKKAIITRIIEKFPKDSEFIIAVGHLKEQVKSYLELAHPDAKLTLVEVDNFDGPGSGPGHSLECCEPYLRRPFYFITCDTLWDGPLPSDKYNWMAGKKVPSEGSERFCNLVVDPTTNDIIALKDKVRIASSAIAWAGFSYVKDPNVFWQSMLGTDVEINGEKQLSNGFSGLARYGPVGFVEMDDWVDVGTLETYRAYCRKFEEYDFGKIDEAVYSVGPRIIKFFADKSIANNRVSRAAEKPSLFPKISNSSNGFFSYDFQPGLTLYEAGLHHVPSFLESMHKDLWEHRPEYESFIKASCMNFYKNKTLQRLALFKKTCPGIRDDLPINGRPCGTMEELVSKIPWDLLADGKPFFIHGDLQFDNIIYDGTGFKLLDWRQDFDGHVEFGDIYYDMAKLLGGSILNYDMIKKNMLWVEERDDGVWIDFAIRDQSKWAQDQILVFAGNMGLDTSKVRLLTALVFLNMSALHHPDFNKLLYYYGKLMLKNELSRDHPLPEE